MLGGIYIALYIDFTQHSIIIYIDIFCLHCLFFSQIFQLHVFTLLGTPNGDGSLSVNSFFVTRYNYCKYFWISCANHIFTGWFYLAKRYVCFFLSLFKGMSFLLKEVPCLQKWSSHGSYGHFGCHHCRMDSEQFLLMNSLRQDGLRCAFSTIGNLDTLFIENK